MTLRPCSRCRNLKPSTAYATDNQRSDGLSSRCKACKAEIERERRATAKRKPAPIVELRPGLRLVDRNPVEVAPAGPSVALGAEAQASGGGRHRTALEEAVAAATWLTSVHAAAVSYARSLADLLDASSLEGLLPGRAEPQYLLALKALGLVHTPAAAESDKPAMLNVSGY